LGLALARIDPTLPKHEGIVALVIDMKSPQVEVRPLRQMNGDTHFNEVFLNDVRVDARDQVGAAGEGWTVARTVLGFERQAFGSEGSGTGAGVRHRLIELARTSSLGLSPVRRDRLMRLICNLEVARLTMKRAGALAAAGTPSARTSAGSKLRMAANIKEIANLAVELEGAAGMLAEGPWAELLLTSPSLSIRGGTDEVQRNLVGEQVLGLPHEPRVDRPRPVPPGFPSNPNA
jgi:alkylation response protein AidB-like acyl-CoA dehydrogenase